MTKCDGQKMTKCDIGGRGSKLKSDVTPSKYIASKIAF